MNAKLTIKRTSDNNIRYQIRNGKKGTGKILWECNSWDNPQATGNAEFMLNNFVNRNKIELVQEEILV